MADTDLSFWRRIGRDENFHRPRGIDQCIVVGAAVALVLLVVLVVIYWSSGDPPAKKPATSEQAAQLAKQAESDTDPAARKAAANRLAELVPRPQDSSSGGSANTAASSLEPGVATANKSTDVSTAQLRQLVKGGGDPEVRATAAQGLGWAMDWESVPDLLKMCDDPSPLVRGRAGAALQLILGADYHFRANDDSQTRKKAIEGMKQVYQQAKGPPRRAP